jgi:hypothetical protein
VQQANEVDPQKGVYKLQTRLKTHTALLVEYETKKIEKESQDRMRPEHERLAKVAKINDHLPVKSCANLSATHPRE